MSQPRTLNLRLDTGSLRAQTLPALLGLVRAAESSGVASVTLSDRLTGGPTRLDALIAASALAPVTTSIGLIPEVVSGITEPFHTATAIQTIDHASLGRAGLALRPGLDRDEHATQGRWPATDITTAAIYADADDTLEAIARLWESWQPDAVIRDRATDRFLDRTRIHDAAFTGHRFSIEGASITPRSPQGRPPVLIQVHDDASATLARHRADIAVVAPDAGLLPILRESSLRQHSPERTGWATDALQVWAELPLSDLARAHTLVEAGFDGIQLIPTAAEHTPAALTAVLTATTNEANEATTLRERLGLSAAHNPYTTQEAHLVNAR
ncbi:MAG: LLM class flavin-dependent oxidoreductase [Galactobacter sp.]